MRYALLAAAVLLPGSAAAASETCAGTANTVLVCVTAGESTTYAGDCVYVGGDACVPVEVTGPQLTCSVWVLGHPSRIACRFPRA